MRREPGTYGILENWVLEAMRTLRNATEKQLLLELAMRSNYDYKSQVMGIGELHDLLGLDIRSIRGALAVLLALKFVCNVEGDLYCLVDTMFTSEQIQVARANAVPVPSRFIPTHIRGAVFARDGYVCTYCGGEEDLSLDHMQPWSRGGQHTLENLVVACRTCNSSKHAKTPDEWAAIRVVN